MEDAWSAPERGPGRVDVTHVQHINRPLPGNPRPNQRVASQMAGASSCARHARPRWLLRKTRRRGVSDPRTAWSRGLCCPCRPAKVRMTPPADQPTRS